MGLLSDLFAVARSVVTGDPTPAVLAIGSDLLGQATAPDAPTGSTANIPVQRDDPVPGLFTFDLSPAAPAVPPPVSNGDFSGSGEFPPEVTGDIGSGPDVTGSATTLPTPTEAGIFSGLGQVLSTAGTAIGRLFGIGTSGTGAAVAGAAGGVAAAAAGAGAAAALGSGVLASGAFKLWRALTGGTTISAAALASFTTRTLNRLLAFARANPGTSIIAILTGVGLSAGEAASLLGWAFSKKRRRRHRGITARDVRTTRRTMRKIVRLYHMLPHRTSHRSFGGRGSSITAVRA